ncbi:hypothetical protein RZS08_18375, partial [Arthrospira platensis SPKY1]|nr:hypothetical protein [Arthrospira platensis SPKY1]
EGTPLFDLVKWVRENMQNPISPHEVAKTWQNLNDIFFFKTNSKELKEKIKEFKTVAVCFKNLTVLNFNWLIGSTKSMKKDYRLNEINEGDDLMFDSFYYHKSKNLETSFYTSNIVNVLKINKNQTETFTIKTKMIKAIVFDELEVMDLDGEIHKI